MSLIRIIKSNVRRCSEYYDIKRYGINAGDMIAVQNYKLNDYKIKINNKK